MKLLKQRLIRIKTSIKIRLPNQITNKLMILIKIKMMDNLKIKLQRDHHFWIVSEERVQRSSKRTTKAKIQRGHHS
jgi:hypothetical protein